MGFYDSLFNLLMIHVYGLVDVSLLSPDQSLTLTILATAGAIFLVSLPFILVFRVLRFFR